VLLHGWYKTTFDIQIRFCFLTMRNDYMSLGLTRNTCASARMVNDDFLATMILCLDEFYWLWLMNGGDNWDSSEGFVFRNELVLLVEFQHNVKAFAGVFAESNWNHLPCVQQSICILIVFPIFVRWSRASLFKGYQRFISLITMSEEMELCMGGNVYLWPVCFASSSFKFFQICVPLDLFR